MREYIETVVLDSTNRPYIAGLLRGEKTDIHNIRNVQFPYRLLLGKSLYYHWVAWLIENNKVEYYHISSLGRMWVDNNPLLRYSV